MAALEASSSFVTLFGYLCGVDSSSVFRRQPTGNYEELMAESRLQGEVDDDHDGARRRWPRSPKMIC